MKAVANPFAPGAGAPPPEMAGRDSILDDATLAIQRNMGGKSARTSLFPWPLSPLCVPLCSSSTV